MECIVQLTTFSLQVDRVDRWIWTLTISSAYYYLTETDYERQQQHNNNNFLWCLSKY